MSSGDLQFAKRFVIRRRLGAGGMGVVYAAYDPERNETVALKTLQHVSASTIYRFKKEFRTLADVAHPNLVSLYELVVEGDQCFFTMELVEGMSFVEYVRGSLTPGAPDAATLSRIPSDEWPTLSGEGLAPESPGLNLERLQSSLRQLAEGVFALHEAGKVHCDLKPSNVMVTPGGRVVILDFGLATELDPSNPVATSKEGISGTLAYIAPEQIRGSPSTAASDLYAMGVILYQVLTGQLPYTGSAYQILFDKQHRDPQPPSSLVPDLPAHLVDLSMELLARDPEDRPSDLEVLRRVGASPPSGLRNNLLAPRHDVPLVGRQSYLAALEGAFGDTQRGQVVSIYVHGPSGIGKTSLVQHFIDRLVQQKRAVVLAGRCYERELIPYKALDGVVDSLSKYLMSLPQPKADALMPRDVMAISRLFPVMLQVKAVASAPRRGEAIVDGWELRRRAFAALRELLARISDRQHLVLFIDDFQWADADSSALLVDLLRPPDPPPLLLVISFRHEEIGLKPFLKALLEQTGSETCRSLRVGPLSEEEARDLTHSLLTSEVPRLRQFAETIVREAAGNPFFVEQLARYALGEEGAATRGISLGDMLEARVRRLPAGARQLLDIMAVAGRPIEASVAYQAAGLAGAERSLVSSLRAAHLLRSSGSTERVELYHDRIRETLSALLEPDAVQQIHRALAGALEASGVDDPEALFEHYLGAGDRNRAAIHSTAAAKKAADALAFDRAALFYRRTLELAPVSGSDGSALKTGLADALANAGRSPEAARAYLDAAEDSGSGKALDLQRRAAEQLLMGGHIDEGLEVMKVVMKAVRLSLSRGPRRALLSLIRRRVQLWYRGLHFVERRAEQIPEDTLLRIDICWAVAVGMGLVDMVRGADFQTLHLLLALRAGEPYRIARALAIEAGFSAAPGGASRKRAARFVEAAEGLSRRVDHPHAIGLATLMAGVAAYLIGQWRKASELCARAEGILREQCTGVVWEQVSSQNFLLGSLMFLGEVREISNRLPLLLEAANERGNLYAATELQTRHNLVWLAADDPDGARHEAVDAMQRWSHEGFHRQHYNFLLAMTQIDLYNGAGRAAWDRVTAQWPALENSMYLRVQLLRIEAIHLRARCALAAAIGAERSRFLRIAERLARRISMERMFWSEPLALLVRAGIARLRGDVSAAAALLYPAADGFAAAEMGLYAAAVRRCLGQIVGGEKGRHLVEGADSWMAGQRIINPARMTLLLAPGLAGESVA